MSEPSREERTLRTLLLIARSLHELTNDSKDRENVDRVMGLINDYCREELQYGR